jgi:hypothetical protein
MLKFVVHIRSSDVNSVEPDQIAQAAQLAQRRTGSVILELASAPAVPEGYKADLSTAGLQPRPDAATEREMMAHYFRKQQEEQVRLTAVLLCNTCLRLTADTLTAGLCIVQDELDLIGDHRLGHGSTLICSGFCSGMRGPRWGRGQHQRRQWRKGLALGLEHWGLVLALI